MTPILSTRNLTIGYPRHEVARDLSLSLGQGELTVLLGANGCGKSTLLRTLCGLQPPLEGIVELCGKNLADMPARRRARMVSLVCTDHGMSGGLTVEEAVALGRQPYTGFFGRLSHEDRTCVDAALADMGISGMARRYVATLSDGERQKVMIARALAQHTPLIVLDEPTTFLDVASRLDVMAMLSRLARAGKSILLSTHDVTEALTVADSAWLMADGCITSGRVDRLAADGAFDRLFTDRGIRFDAEARAYRIG